MLDTWIHKHVQLHSNIKEDDKMATNERRNNVIDLGRTTDARKWTTELQQ